VSNLIDLKDLQEPGESRTALHELLREGLDAAVEHGTDCVVALWAGRAYPDGTAERPSRVRQQNHPGNADAEQIADNLLKLLKRQVGDGTWRVIFSVKAGDGDPLVFDRFVQVGSQAGFLEGPGGGGGDWGPQPPSWGGFPQGQGGFPQAGGGGWGPPAPPRGGPPGFPAWGPPGGAAPWGSPGDLPPDQVDEQHRTAWESLLGQQERHLGYQYERMRWLEERDLAKDAFFMQTLEYLMRLTTVLPRRGGLSSGEGEGSGSFWGDLAGQAVQAGVEHLLGRSNSEHEDEEIPRPPTTHAPPPVPAFGDEFDRDAGNGAGHDFGARPPTQEQWDSAFKADPKGAMEAAARRVKNPVAKKLLTDAAGKLK